MTIRWRNWSGLQRSVPQQLLMPTNTDALAKVIRQHQKIRVVGAGHSFSPLVTTEDTLVSLDHFQGLIDYDAAEQSAQLWAGTRIHHLPKILDPINQALQNQGDIDQQSLAGAISTGTHGTGIHLPCLSDLVTEFELVTAQGNVLTCNQHQHAEIFMAGRVGLGSLGVLSKVTFQNRARYKLKEHLQLSAVQDILTQMNTWKNQHRHIEAFIFPFHDYALLKTLNETEDAIQQRTVAFPSEDTLLTLCCELGKIIPSIIPILQKMLGVFIKETEHVNWSSKVFPTPRHTKFNEMEYQVPIAQGMQCLEEIIHTFRRQQLPCFFPIEVRYVKADDIWLSPFYQQDSLSISVHQYAKQDYGRIFNQIEPIFWQYGARPHWGKLHSLKACDLENLYPKWQDFLNLRAELDPDKKFLNPYLQQMLLGESS